MGKSHLFFIRVFIVFHAVSLSVWADDHPNIVFIMSDDQGYGDLGCYGATDLQTPNLDQLAKEGIRFTNYYANGSTCSPTRAAFLTGRYQQRLGLDNALYYQEMGRGLPAEGATVASDLKSAGYVTGLSGKWHLGYDHDRKPLQQGFDHYFGLLGGNHHYFAHMDRIGVPDLWLDNDPIEREGYTTDLITDDACRFVEENAERPFFLYVAHAAPHFPWQGPGDADKEVVPKKKSWQTGDRDTYIAMVEKMDECIGRLLNTIKEKGLSDKTLVVFCSDNGGHTYSSNAPLSGEKSTIWEGGIRVPCIARWPGVLPAGQTLDFPVITMDWSATFRRLAGSPVSEKGEDGINILPVLKAEAEPEVRSLFWRRKSGPRRKVDNPSRAVRRGDWKLLEMKDGESYLFRLDKDPGEKENLISNNPEIAEELSRELDRWEAEVDSEQERSAKAE